MKPLNAIYVELSNVSTFPYHLGFRLVGTVTINGKQLATEVSALFHTIIY